MARLEFNTVLGIAILAGSLSIMAGRVFVWFQASKTQHLTMAAGSSSGESYILGTALKRVLERRYPNIRITLLETGGTVENLRMLEEGHAQLANTDFVGLILTVVLMAGSWLW